MLSKAILLVAMATVNLPAGQPGELHGAHFPALSPDASQVAFTYAGDIWVANVKDGIARRLTVHEAYDYRATWSPDGQWIAFVSDRDGDNDIYLMPAMGGKIKRLTYHSANDRVTDWSPDGKRLLLATQRNDRFQTAYELDMATLRARRLLTDVTPITPGTYLPDGRRWVGVRRGTTWWRTGYRGALNGEIILFDPEANTMKQLTHFDGFDAWPMAAPDGRTIYYVTEEFGRKNIAKLDLTTGKRTPLTKFTEDAVTWPKISRDGSAIVFEHANELWIVYTKTGEVRQIKLYGPIDYRENFVERKTFTGDVQEMEVSPDGKYLCIRVNNDLFLVRPDLKNDSIRLTDYPGFDGDFTWSPDSKKIVFTSDRGGNSDLYIADVETRQVTPLLVTPEYERKPKFSPDGKKVLFVRSLPRGLYWVPAEGGEAKLLLAEPFVEGFEFSPDWKWLAVQLEDTQGNTDIYIMPAEGGEPVNVTKYPTNNWSPIWSPNGEKLFFLSNRTGNADIFALELQKEKTKFDDYEAQLAEKKEKEKPKPQGEGKGPGQLRPPIAPITIDFARIEYRAKRLTRTAENEYNVTVCPKGDKLVYCTTYKGERQIWQISPEGENAKPFLPGRIEASFLRWTANGDALYFVSGGRIRKTGPGGGRSEEISFRAEVEIDRRQVQIEAFKQGWSLLKERFYDVRHHGVDWLAVRDKYAQWIDGTLVPRDFDFLMSRMIGELNASHLGCWGRGRSGPQCGRLGLWYDQEYTGPGVRVVGVMPDGPADKRDCQIKPGEYILRVDGKDVTLNEEFFRLLRGKVGKRVRLLVNDKPSPNGAREVSIKPISGSAFHNLWYEKWVEDNRKLVYKLSGGRYYYIHIRAMDRSSLERFRRELWGEAQKYEGVVLDIRYNGGGRIHDELLEELTKKTHVYERPAGAPPHTQPWHLFEGPVVLVINEHCASDAEIFPNGFRTKKIGKIVGMKTYGGVIGTYNVTLVNGHTFRVPVTGWFTLEGINLENYGVPPDVEVPYPYEAVVAGRDPQLEAAVRVLDEESKRRPRRRPPQSLMYLP